MSHNQTSVCPYVACMVGPSLQVLRLLCHDSACNRSPAAYTLGHCVLVAGVCQSLACVELDCQSELSSQNITVALKYIFFLSNICNPVTVNVS